MPEYKFRGVPVEQLSNAQLIKLVKWLMDRLEEEKDKRDMPDFMKGLFK